VAAQGLRNVGELIANGDTRLPDVARLVLQVLANQIEQIIRANASTTAKHPNLAATLTLRPGRSNRASIAVQSRCELVARYGRWAKPRRARSTNGRILGAAAFCMPAVAGCNP
jgi:hypothetical protein